MKLFRILKLWILSFKLVFKWTLIFYFRNRTKSNRGLTKIFINSFLNHKINSSSMNTKKNYNLCHCLFNLQKLFYFVKNLAITLILFWNFLKFGKLKIWVLQLPKRQQKCMLCEFCIVGMFSREYKWPQFSNPKIFLLF